MLSGEARPDQEDNVCSDEANDDDDEEESPDKAFQALVAWVKKGGMPLRVEEEAPGGDLPRDN